MKMGWGIENKITSLTQESSDLNQRKFISEPKKEAHIF